MPKKSQRKKKAQHEDFKKPKLKVGKKKPQASNFTDTSFKSRAISLPEQSIAKDKSDEITNTRNLSLNDLVTQLKHYSPVTRKDSIQGLRDFFHKHPSILSRSLSTIVNPLSRLLVDDDRGVRRSLLAFFTEFFLKVQKFELRPFLPLLIIYTCSAMTHIYDDIRTDSIKFMELWLEIAPDVVVNEFWQRIVPNYIRLLTMDTSINVNSSVSNIIKNSIDKNQFWPQEIKIEILSSFHKLLKYGLTLEGNEDTHLFFLNFLSTEHSKQSAHFSKQHVFVDLIQNHEMAEAAPPHPLTSTILPSLFSSSITYHAMQLNIFNCTTSTSKTEQGVDRINVKVEASQHDMRNEKSDYDYSTAQERVTGTKDLLNILNPILLSLWLDTAPSLFGTISSLTRITSALQIVYLVMKIMVILWRTILRIIFMKQDILDKQWIENNLTPLLKHFIIYFPFGAESSDVCDIKVESIIQEMNIIFCELVILYLAATSSNLMKVDKNKKGILINTETGSSFQKQINAETKSFFRKQKKISKAETHELHSLWIEKIAEYVILTLESDSVKGENRLPKVGFKSEHLKNLIPTLWGLLSYSNKEIQESIFQAILDYSKQCHSQSTAKQICIKFISKILMLQSFSNYKNSFCIQKESSLVKSLHDWILILPKLLCDLKTNNLETSQDILNVLCDIAKRGNKSVLAEEILEQLQVLLVPFFYMELHNKEPLYGPFISLPQIHQPSIK
ncbi:Pre-rRNA-processing protein IPI1 [Gigaspora margarita]|uniref:Pre-rRNA-processing protein n=1 Tax=Gigaspora margarita TaxID=4874 RepID=A0A8H3WVC5_GIGMA|nr:Pre-rRNA-processing protein IPI1 [Gigaspora margarita]